MDADIRIVRGNASAEELAVVTAVLLAAARTRAAAPAPEETAGATILRWPGADRAHRPAGTWLTTPAPHWRHAA
ncbi:acyl-CoA carboxylase epsilon subunit [Streptantibioticus parmotrematis]|uniref:acyl-CoA carboxylase epsilon subunit n=1 Tax=Streptantibioticus parmotrematis TaxID=2873249 RepID=UPI0033DD3DE9